MADIEVEGPDGSTFSFPEGTTPDVIKGVIQKHYGTGKGFFGRLNDTIEHYSDEASKDLGDVASGVYNTAKTAVTNPGAIVQGVGDLVLGAGSKIARKTGLTDLLATHGLNPEEAEIARDYEARKAAFREKLLNTAIGQKVEQWKDPLAHPFSSALDLSTLFAPAAALESAPGVIGQAGRALSATGRAIDPVAAPFRAVGSAANLTGKGYAFAAGHGSGAAPWTIGQVFNDYRAGLGDRVAKYMSGEGPVSDLVTMAQNAWTALKKKAQGQYLSDMASVKESKANLDFGPIRDKVNQWRDDLTFNGEVDNGPALNTLDRASRIIEKRAANPTARNIPDAVAPPQQLMASGPFRSEITSPGSVARLPDRLESVAPYDVGADGLTGGTVTPTRVVPGENVGIPAQPPTLANAFDNLFKQQSEAPHAPRINGPTGNGQMGPFQSPHYTPEGFDRLKRAIGSIVERTRDGTVSRAVATDLYNTIKTQIIDQAPEYAKAMQGYSEAQSFLGEARKALGIGGKAGKDAAVRKLMQASRETVNGTHGNKLSMIDALEAEQPGIRSAIAGTALSSWAPRGLAARLGVNHAGLAAAIDHSALPLLSLGLASPKLAGKVAAGAGTIARGVDATGALASKLGIDPLLMRTLGLGSTEMGGLLGP